MPQISEASSFHGNHLGCELAMRPVDTVCAIKANARALQPRSDPSSTTYEFIFLQISNVYLYLG